MLIAWNGLRKTGVDPAQALLNLDRSWYAAVGGIRGFADPSRKISYLNADVENLGIDGSCLSSLSEEDFREELGVTSKIMLKKIMACTSRIISGIGNGFKNYDDYLKANKLAMTFKAGSLIKTIQPK